jgi:hypothetical protein
VPAATSETTKRAGATSPPCSLPIASICAPLPIVVRML